MRIEMLRPRGYRGEALDAGIVVEVDDGTARWFIASGWAREAVEAPALPADTVDELAPTGQKRRRALR